MDRRRASFAVLALMMFLTATATATGADEPSRCGAVDQTAKRRRVPKVDRGGNIYPVVTIHGITGSDEDFEGIVDKSYRDAKPDPPRTLLDLLAGPKNHDQVLPRGLDHVRVFSFSYTRHSLRWIADERVGEMFGETIDCLYAAFGVPVSVIAHSMGGLVTRWVANSADGEGRPRAPKLGKVITLGTPYLGSDLALLARSALPLAGPKFALLTFLCGQIGTATGSGNCGGIPMLGALDSDAGRALVTGSSDLKALASWPKTAQVHTIATRINLGLELIGSKLNRAVGVGDIVVGTESATADPSAGRVFTCDYDSPTSTLATQLKHVLGLASAVDRQRQLGRLLLGGPCYHEHLQRNVEVTNEMIGDLNDWITARGRPTCKSPEAEADYIGNRLARRLAGFTSWGEAPTFEREAKPLIDVLRPCGRVFAMRVAGALDVVGRTWRAITGWIEAWDPSSDTMPPGTATSCPGHTSAAVCAFLAPSGNIACAIYAASPSHARCDIQSRSWSVRRPVGCAPESDFGQGLVVESTGPAKVVCAGDTVMGNHPVLAYGQTATLGGFRCESTSSRGVTCRNLRTERGFRIARASYELF